jgi:rare lipoprotein A (peptidoglycan hydrolase)
VVISGCTAQVATAPTPPTPVGYVQQYHPPQMSAPPARVHSVKASSYGAILAGSRTTSGEPYDPNQLTAASKTLPLGSIVRVTNPANGRSVKVRINDCGPYVHGRGLDLSHRAAEDIGITRKGVASVKVTKVTTVSHGESCPD